MFAIILAYTNDYIPKEKFVVAGAGLQTAFGLGAMSGPFLCSMLMSFVGPNGFWMFLIFFHSCHWFIWCLSNENKKKSRRKSRLFIYCQCQRVLRLLEWN
jgi:MFS family permease